jgi:hypothetical protein
MNSQAIRPRVPPRLLRIVKYVCLLAAISVIVVFGTFGYNVGPAYYYLTLTAVVPVIGFVFSRRAIIKVGALLRARKHWAATGAELERVQHTMLDELRRSYRDLTREDDCGFVDDRTWADLGMDDLVEEIDVCFTMAGRNELVRTLGHALPDEQRRARLANVSSRFTSDPAYRDRVAAVLSSIGEERNADPATLLWESALRRDPLLPLFVTMSALALLSIAFTVFINPTFGFLLIIAVFFTNMWIYYRKARHLSGLIPALRVLSRMIAASDSLGVRQELIATARRVRGPLKWLLTGAPSPTMSVTGDISEAILLYIKIFFQVDLIAYERAIEQVRSDLTSYQELYQEIGLLDVAFALSSFRARETKVCDAQITAGGQNAPEAHAVNTYHPLLEEAVPNSVSLRRPGAIVTGTNMAGKSTFLRTIGINVLLAQTAGFAFAEDYSGSRFRLVSSINKRDDLAQGKSFYYDEAERIYRMIEEVGTGQPTLLLIDELLAGTNSLERESASMAILHYLAGRNAVTVAATHDVNIARGVADRYALYYFTDHADEKGLSFDYHLHEGVVGTRNAIRLLRLIGYPEDIIRAALERTGDPDLQ